MKLKIRKGDTVEVISGRRFTRGKRGEVIKVFVKDRRVVVEGLNIRKKHVSETRAQGRRIQSGIIEFEASMDISNVMLVCPRCGETTRIRIERDEDGVAYRACKKCDTSVD